MKTRRNRGSRFGTRTSVLVLVLLLSAALVAASQIVALDTPASLSLTPTSVTGGNSVTGTIKLSNPAPAEGVRFWVKSTDESIASTPPSVIVPAGKTTVSFTVSTKPVSTSQDVKIRSAGWTLHARLTATLTVTPPAAPPPPPPPSGSPALSSLSLSPSSVVESTSATGTVKLSAVAPSGGASVSLSSSKASVAGVPAAVTVAQGRLDAKFTISTFDVSSATSVTISASSGGSTRNATVTVNPQSTPAPAPSLSSLTLNPATVVGGSSSVGTLTLSAAAPTGGASVSVKSSNVQATVPLTVNMPAGATSTTFSISTTTVSASATSLITASYGGANQSATLTMTAASSQPPPSGGGATLYVSASGSDANACTQAAPCKTFDRSYRAAKPGDTVLVLSGTYPTQSIPYDASKSSTACDGFSVPVLTSGCVTFQAAAGAAVAWTSGGSIDIYGSDVRILGFNFGPGGVTTGGVNITSCNNISTPASYVIVDGVKAGINGHVGGPSHHVAILNSTWDFQNTNTSALGFQINNCGGAVADQPHHLRIDHSTFKNVYETAAHHNTCMHATNGGGSNPGNFHDFVLSNSTFLNCAESDIEIQTSSGRYYNITLENNVFAPPCSGQPGVNPIGNTCISRSSVILGCNVKPYPNHENVVVRFNDMGTAVDWDAYYCGTIGNASGAVGSGETGNIFAGSSSCNSLGLAYLYNIVGSGSACGTGGAVAANQWVNPSAYDFHLLSCSVKAANFVPTSVAGGYPATDMYGNSRPKNGMLDAGAHESC